MAWASARAQSLRFLVRMEDLDRVTSSPEHERRQLDDLRAIGIDWDGEVVRQSDRFARYDAAIRRLAAADLTYDCFCTRREIREAASAPHAHLPDGAYPGTCRHLAVVEREQRREEGRRPALRLRNPHVEVTVHDALSGEHTGLLDDVVLRRNDGVPAYNLAVVVDDAEQGVVEVVRGDDLLPSTPRQVHLQHLLGLPTPRYVHVPLVLGPDGERLAKRHGAVTLSALAARGLTAERVRALLAESLGWAEPGEPVQPADLVQRFDLATMTRAPWQWRDDLI